MGVKGKKQTPIGVSTMEALMKKLDTMEEISSKRMFGGFGIFHRSKMFGIVDSNGTGYFKADDSISSEFQNRGSHKHNRMPYFSIPEEVFENTEELLIWAKRSIDLSN